MFKAIYREILQMGAFQHELLQGPLLETILVKEVLDCKLLETQLCVDRAAEYVNKRVQHV